MKRFLLRLISASAGSALLLGIALGLGRNQENRNMILSGTAYAMEEAASTDTAVDKRNTVTYTLTEEAPAISQGETPEIITDYFVQTNLPVIYLTTESGQGITSNRVYAEGTCHYEGKEVACAMRGRGNASWTTYPQKSYLLKFETPISFLGMKPSRKWVLRSNYGDPALVRDAVATDIAFAMERLEFTARTYAVDVILNGRYIGVYQLAEKVEVSKGKVDLFSREENYPFMAEKCLTYGEILAGENYALQAEDTAFLMETSFDFYNSHEYGLEYFKVGHLPSTFISYPEPVEENRAAIQAAIAYMTEVDQAIVKGENIEDYLDLDSFVDWFIVMEMTFNTDSSFNRSTYLYKRPGEKLKIGPVWDFDHAFGNFKFDEPTYQSWCTGEAIYAMCQHHWPDDLVRNDTFMKRVQERFDEKKEVLESIVAESVARHMLHVAGSAAYESRCYGIMVETDPAQISTFLMNRLQWMEDSLHMENYNRHPATISINWEPPTGEDEEDSIEEVEDEVIQIDMEVQEDVTGEVE